MLKIYPRSNDCSSDEYQKGYMLMREVFDDLVFCGNLEGRVPAGTDCVYIDAEPEDVAISATEIWRNNPMYDDPDHLIKMEFAD